MDLVILLKKFINIFHFHEKSRKRDIYIFSTPRSGSTWLMELIQTQPKIKVVAEPLINKELINNYHQLSKPQWRYIQVNQEDAEKMYDYFTNLSKGKIPAITYFNVFSRYHSFLTDRTLFKILRANDLIGWLNDNFEMDGIYLIRHPIPSCLSRAKNNWDYYIDLYVQNKAFCDINLNDDLIDVIENIKKNGTILQKFIVSWCLENLSIVKKIKNKELSDNFILLTYEELVMNPYKVIDMLSEKLNLEKKKRMYKKIQTPSSTTHFSSTKTKKVMKHKYDRDYLIRKWKDEINNEEEKEIFKILKKFNIDIYKYNQLMPSAKYLNFNDSKI
ncbi:MAG: sulfotransferase [Clostridiales bacterium]|nr:sulfotransferase [Clostridiales bacterium]MCF8022799.1 sulfotransferase [Clostridiales bacterium]